jgi:hypothetical protein
MIIKYYSSSSNSRSSSTQNISIFGKKTAESFLGSGSGEISYKLDVKTKC